MGQVVSWSKQGAPCRSKFEQLSYSPAAYGTAEYHTMCHDDLMGRREEHRLTCMGTAELNVEGQHSLVFQPPVSDSLALSLSLSPNVLKQHDVIDQETAYACTNALSLSLSLCQE